MATKRQLKDRAVSLGAKLGDIDRLNHEALTALVVELEAKASGPTAEPESAPVEPPASAPEPESTPAPEAPVVEATATPDPEPPAAPVPPLEPEPTAAVLALRTRAADVAAARKASTRYVVAEGRVLYCARAGGAGLRAGEAIRDSDFTPEHLRTLIAQGAVLEA